MRRTRFPLAAPWAAAAILLIAWGGFSSRVRAETGRGARDRQPEVMSGDFRGLVVTLVADRALVQSWLPQGLVLASETPLPQHPVIVMFGVQQNIARTKRVTRYPRGMQDYLETLIAIPYLKMIHQPNGPPVLHFARVYLNSWPATNQGIKRFGWPKVYTDLAWSDAGYRIGREPVFVAQTAGAEPPPVDFNEPSLHRLREMLSQPLVLKHEGRFEVYDFDFHFETATIQPAAVELEIREGFMPRVAPREVSVPSIADEPYGAFHFDCHFTKVAMTYGEDRGPRDDNSGPPELACGR